jgi:hypothetical protein
MFPVPFLLTVCLCGGPPPAQVPRGVVVDVFSDGTMLISAGSADEVEKGDSFNLVGGLKDPEIIGKGVVVTVGTSYSVARFVHFANRRLPQAGDGLVETNWDAVKRRRDFEAKRGGAIIDRPDR